MGINYIAIEGNIGVGKTSLAQKISDDLNARFIPEQFDNNPFLPLFYQNPSKYAFQLELSFLIERYQQLIEKFQTIDLFHPLTISDYFFYKTLIFAQNNLTEPEFFLFKKLFYLISPQIPKPDLIIFLHSSIKRLIENIKKRGREYEKNITKDYLEKIQEKYFHFFETHQHNFKIVIINTTEIDFINNPNDFDKIKKLILKNYPIGITRITDINEIF